MREADPASGTVERRLGPATPGLVERIRRDAAVAGSTAGAPLHLAAVRDVRVVDGEVVVVRDHVDGMSLADVLAGRGALTPAETVTVIAPLAAVLSALHGRGLVHGAVHERNVVIATDGRPVLTDGGLAVAPSSSPADDVRAVARLGLKVLAGTRSDVGDLLAATVASPGEQLSMQLLATAPPAPVQLPGPRAQPPSAEQTTSAIARGVAVMLAAAVAIVAGATIARPAAPAAGVVSPAASATTPVAAPAPARTRASSVSFLRAVRRLEGMRAAAYRTDRAKLLRAVYPRGSDALRRDMAQLHRVLSAGDRARGFRAVVVAVRVVAESASAATLAVTDALTSYDVVDRSGRVLWHGDGRAQRAVVVQLLRSDGGWLISSVT